MVSKEEYYKSVLKNRELVKDKNITKCTCPNTLCDFHSKCDECVALHRYYKEHIPVCLQPILKDKLRDLTGAIEMEMVSKEKTPIEYRKYVKEMDKFIKEEENKWKE